MKVKTYKNRSLQEGLEDIKRDLGSEALILNTRAIKERPKFGLFKQQAWEITAALEEAVVGDTGVRGVRPVVPATQGTSGLTPLPPVSPFSQDGDRVRVVAKP